MLNSIARSANGVCQTIRRSHFARDVLLLSGGTGFAQLIGLAILPVLSRLYTPQDFGILTLYISVVSLLSLFASFAFDLMIMLPRSHRAASQLVWLTLAIGMAAAAVILLVAVLLQHQIASLLGTSGVAIWFWSMPLALLLGALYQALRYWKMRLGQFEIVARSTIMRSIVFGLLSIGLAYLTPLDVMTGGGLIIAFLLSELAKTAVLVFSVSRIDRKEFAPARWRRICTMRRRHCPMAATMTVTGGIALGSDRIPDLFITSFFGAATLGHYGMVERIVATPSRLVSKAIGDVFRQRASVLHRSVGRFDSLALKALGSTAIIAIVPFLIAIACAPTAFTVLLGPDWTEAGRYASILLVGELFAFVITPIDSSTMIVGASRFLFVWHLMRLILTLSLLPLLHLGLLDFAGFLWAIVGIRIFMISLDGLASYVCSQGDQARYLWMTK